MIFTKKHSEKPNIMAMEKNEIKVLTIFFKYIYS